MERLQVAIDRARREREERARSEAGQQAATPPSPPRVVPEPQREEPKQDSRDEPRPQPEASSSKSLVVAAEEAWKALPLHKVESRHLARNRLIGAKSDALSIQVDILRTRLLKQMRSESWRRVMVTSPGPGCGKTALCCNLAFSLLRQKDVRALVLDFSLRNPALGPLLQIPEDQRPGIGAVLAGDVDFGAAAVRLGEQVAVCAAKNGPESSPELLKSQATRDMIEKIEEDYEIDMVILDVPPLFANDDAIGVAQMVDCGVIVAAAGQTSIAQLDKAEREIAQYTEVAGIVANKLRFDKYAA